MSRAREPDEPPPVEIRVRVQPRAGRSAFAGLHDGMLKVRLAAAPVEGAANRELISFLAKALGVAKSRIVLVGGLTGRTKRVRVSGLTREEVFERAGLSEPPPGS